jgi:hypothetical protein
METWFYDLGQLLAGAEYRARLSWELTWPIFLSHHLWSALAAAFSKSKRDNFLLPQMPRLHEQYLEISPFLARTQ